MKISELEPNTKVINLVATISQLEEPGETSTGVKFQEGVLEDSTGQVKITLWGEHVGIFQQGHKIIMSTGWCKKYQEDLQVSTGKHGKIKKVPPEKPE